MRVDNVQNSPCFGIKYSNKEVWSPKTLKAFENSELLKSIDKKYPNASVRYTKISGEDGFGNSDFFHTLILDIKLLKGKIFRWNISSHSEDVPDKLFINDLEKMTLEDIEHHAEPILKPSDRIFVNVDKQNPIKAFF
ncbi:hypothetical protein IKQ21_06820 [bacterium]|nr:hypothetical protein [bacterium]